MEADPRIVDFHTQSDTSKCDVRPSTASTVASDGVCRYPSQSSLAQSEYDARASRAAPAVPETSFTLKPHRSGWELPEQPDFGHVGASATGITTSIAEAQGCPESTSNRKRCKSRSKSIVTTDWSLPGCLHAEVVDQDQCSLSDSAPSDGDTDLQAFRQLSPRMLHSGEWDSRGKTMILIDWDDTLCPSSSLKKFFIAGAVPNEVEKQLLLLHEATVTDFLATAAELGQVTILSIATEKWIQSTMRKVMPGLATVLKELNIEIISGRKSSKWMFRSAFFNDRDPAQFLKTNAMKRIIKQFHKNIVSIGDSTAERLALQDLMFHHKQRNQCDMAECYFKTVLMLQKPTLEQIGEELRTTKQIISELVHYRGDLDIDMDIRDIEVNRN